MGRKPRTRRGATSILGSPLYSIMIQHAASAHFYIATLPEWEGRYTPPAGMGATYDEALRNAEATLGRLLPGVLECGEEMPQPRLFAGAAPDNDGA
jgi:predicted RNase H-like HicB family nuclease